MPKLTTKPPCQYVSIPYKVIEKIKVIPLVDFFPKNDFFLMGDSLRDLLLDLHVFSWSYKINISSKEFNAVVGKLPGLEEIDSKRGLFQFTQNGIKYNISCFEQTEDQSLESALFDSVQTVDFTVNALALPIKLENGRLRTDSKVIDFFYGMEHLNELFLVPLASVYEIFGQTEKNPLDIPQQYNRVFRLIDCVAHGLSQKIEWVCSAAMIEEIVVAVSKLHGQYKKDNKIVRQFSNSFTKGYGFYTISVIDSLAIGNYIFPDYLHIKDAIAATAILIDKHEGVSLTFGNLCSLLFWPSFVYHFTKPPISTTKEIIEEFLKINQIFLKADEESKLINLWTNWIAEVGLSSYPAKMINVFLLEKKQQYLEVKANEKIEPPQFLLTKEVTITSTAASKMKEEIDIIQESAAVEEEKKTVQEGSCQERNQQTQEISAETIVTSVIDIEENINSLQETSQKQELTISTQVDSSIDIDANTTAKGKPPQMPCSNTQEKVDVALKSQKKPYKGGDFNFRKKKTDKRTSKNHTQTEAKQEEKNKANESKYQRIAEKFKFSNLSFDSFRDMRLRFWKNPKTERSASQSAMAKVAVRQINMHGKKEAVKITVIKMSAEQQQQELKRIAFWLEFYKSMRSNQNIRFVYQDDPNNYQHTKNATYFRFQHALLVFFSYFMSSTIQPDFFPVSNREVLIQWNIVCSITLFLIFALSDNSVAAIMNSKEKALRERYQILSGEPYLSPKENEKKAPQTAIAFKSP